jgi:pimeloyl-ACP methyl ester carboxylesterase
LSGAAGPIALVAANLYVFAFGMSWGPVVWVMLGEKFPNRIRAAALGVAAAAQWIANWLISTTFPALSDIGLGLAYGIYTAAAILSFFFVVRFVSRPRARNWRRCAFDGPAGGRPLPADGRLDGEAVLGCASGAGSSSATTPIKQPP